MAAAWKGRAQGATFKVGVVPLARADGAFDVIAQREGLFAQHGLNVEFVELNTGALVLQGLLAGQVDAVIVSPAGTLAAISRGANLKIIGSHAPGMPYLLYVNDSIRSLADLRGKRIGISQPGSLAHVLVRTLLASAGIDERDTQSVNIGNDAERFRALIADRVDATVTHMEYEPEIANNPRVRVLVNFATQVPDYIRFAIVTRDDVIERRRHDVQAFAIGLAHGVRYVYEHKDVALRLMAEYTRSTPEAMEWIYDWYLINDVLQPNFYLSPDSINFMQELNVLLGQQDRVLPIERVATWEFQEGVVKALGRYPGYPG